MKNADVLIVIVVLLGLASWVLFEFMSGAPKPPPPPKKKTKKEKR